MISRRTGTIESTVWADGSTHYRARIRLADGSRERIDIPERYADTEERRRLYAAAVQERENDVGELLEKKKARREEKLRKASGPETCSTYRQRLDEHRVTAGIASQGTRADNESSWRAWVAPILGDLPMAAVTRDDVERLRDRLDEQIMRHKQTNRAEGISSKRALGVWSVVTTTFKAATSAKLRTLRVRTDNPCEGVLPPERGESRHRTFVYPAEMHAILGCLTVPLEWREVFALGSYLYLRPGELRALTWGDFDLTAGVVHITKAFDERTNALKPPKTSNGVRDVPIPATLVPLLERLQRGRELTDLVAPILARTPENQRAVCFMRAMQEARCTRPRLYENTPTTMAANFRSLRDSGLTWLALAGVDLARIQRRAGHDDVKTTLGYVKQAEDLTGSIGQPFGPLPQALVEGIEGDIGEVSTRKKMGRPQVHWASRRSNAASLNGMGLKTSAAMQPGAMHEFVPANDTRKIRLVTIVKIFFRVS